MEFQYSEKTLCMCRMMWIRPFCACRRHFVFCSMRSMWNTAFISFISSIIIDMDQRLNRYIRTYSAVFTRNHSLFLIVFHCLQIKTANSLIVSNWAATCTINKVTVHPAKTQIRLGIRMSRMIWVSALVWVRWTHSHIVGFVMSCSIICARKSITYITYRDYMIRYCLMRIIYYWTNTSINWKLFITFWEGVKFMYYWSKINLVNLI